MKTELDHKFEYKEKGLEGLFIMLIVTTFLVGTLVGTFLCMLFLKFVY